MPRAKGVPLNDDNSLVKVAKAYYEEGLTKARIAGNLGCSAMTVTRLLREAVDRRIVTITIRDNPQDPTLQLALDLRASYPHLKRVIVTPTVRSAGGSKIAPYKEQLDRMADAGARLFRELVDNDIASDSKKVGFGGGRTVFELISRLPLTERRNVHFYPMALLGRGSGESVAFDPQTLCISAWARSGMIQGLCHYVTIPPYFGRNVAAERSRLLQQKYVKDQLSHASMVDYSFFTLGAIQHELKTSTFDPQDEVERYFSTQQLLRDIHLRPEDLADAAGEVCYSFFDPAGKEMIKHRYFLCVGAERMAKMVTAGKHAVMIAGNFKVTPVLAALKGRLCNYWVTDEACARQVLAIRSREQLHGK